MRINELIVTLLKAQDMIEEEPAPVPTPAPEPEKENNRCLRPILYGGAAAVGAYVLYNILKPSSDKENPTEGTSTISWGVDKAGVEGSLDLTQITNDDGSLSDEYTIDNITGDLPVKMFRRSLTQNVEGEQVLKANNKSMSGLSTLLVYSENTKEFNVVTVDEGTITFAELDESIKYAYVGMKTGEVRFVLTPLTQPDVQLQYGGKPVTFGQTVLDYDAINADNITHILMVLKLDSIEVKDN